MRAMASEDVAAGDGAFRTCSIRAPNVPALPVSNIKSSTSLPFSSNAWARTPAGPLHTDTVQGQKVNRQGHSMKSVKTWQQLQISSQKSAEHYTHEGSPARAIHSTQFKVKRSRSTGQSSKT